MVTHTFFAKAQGFFCCAFVKCMMGENSTYKILHVTTQIHYTINMGLQNTQIWFETQQPTYLLHLH
jgi:hypothetical protein